MKKSEVSKAKLLFQIFILYSNVDQNYNNNANIPAGALPSHSCGIHKDALSFLKTLAHQAARRWGRNNALEIKQFFQRLSVALQRGNASLLINRDAESNWTNTKSLFPEIKYNYFYDAWFSYNFRS